MATQVSPKEVERAELVLKQAKLSIKHFRDAFSTIRRERNASGPPTAGEQDLIRASLTFAAAGLDSVVKELIRGSIRTLAQDDQEVEKGLEEYASRQLRDDKEGVLAKSSANFLASVLVSNSPYEKLIENYTKNLTGSSLQSSDELFRAASALGIKLNLLNDKNKKIREAFKIRNKIIHELDVRFEVRAGQKARNSRTKKDLDEMSDLLLKVASEFIKAVSLKLQAKAK